MKKLFFLFLIFLPNLLFSQSLKEFDLQEMSEQQIPVFVDHPNEATLIFYTAINGFIIESNTGGVVKTQSDGSKFTAFLKPERQILTLKAPGFIEKKFSIDNLSAKQAKFYRLNEKENTYTTETGSCKVQTLPDGALMKIEGFPTFKQLTPFELNEFKAGKYRINLEKPDYFPVDTLIEIRAGMKQSIVFKLKSKYGTLSLKAPVAIKVSLNNQKLDVGPVLNNQRLLAGVYTLIVNDSRFSPYSESIPILSGETTIKEIPLKSVFGTLILKSALPVQVKINDLLEDIRPEPKTVSLKVGNYTLSVNDPRVDPWQEMITLGSGETKTIDLPLIKRVGYLQVLHPDGFDLTVGRETLIKNPETQLIEFFEGSYKAEVKRPGFQKLIFPFTIKKGAVVNWEPVFKAVEEKVTLKTEPSGATVILYRGSDQEVLGFTPLEEQIAVGELEFLIKKEGVNDYRFYVKLEEGKPFRKTINLDNPKLGEYKVINGITYGFLEYNGFTYKTVKIGNQEWTVENLRTTTYNDGTSIRNETDNTEWTKTTYGAYCAYDNNESNVATFGYLYNWYAVNTGKLAPRNGEWRVPSDADWYGLLNASGGSGWAETKLKSKKDWISDGNGTDDFGFRALPGGCRFSQDGTFYNIQGGGYWWSSTADGTNYAWNRYLAHNNRFGSRDGYSKGFGFSVRLVRDIQ